MNPSGLLTASLQSAARGKNVVEILRAALQAVEPEAAIHQHVSRQENDLLVSGKRYRLEDFRRVTLVGAGKAGAPMARAAVDILGDRLKDGLVVVKEGYTGGVQHVGPVRILEAGHPVPDARSVQAGKAVGELLRQNTEEDLVICLISGGGSALLVSPVEGVTLDDIQRLTASLLACGATINEINTIRKHLDGVKGGGLARLASPAALVTLILSDVVGDPLDVIASGPTVADPTTYADAWAVLERYRIKEKTPPAILQTLELGMRGELADTLKPGDPRLDGVQNVVVGSNLQAAEAATDAARRLGFNALLLTTHLQGEARQVGRFLGSIARQLAAGGDPLPRPACLIAGGETTVTLQGGGRGGRNQEICLGAVEEIAGLADIAIVSLATDGGDGPTDAAGAVADGSTWHRARRLGLSLADALAQNDAYPFFDALGDLLKPGPTQTNVNDLSFVFAF